MSKSETHQLMTNIDGILKKETEMTKTETHQKGNTSMTEDSQYFSQGEMIGLEIEYPWIIHFFQTIIFKN